MPRIVQPDTDNLRRAENAGCYSHRTVYHWTLTGVQFQPTVQSIQTVHFKESFSVVLAETRHVYSSILSENDPWFFTIERSKSEQFHILICLQLGAVTLALSKFATTLTVTSWEDRSGRSLGRCLGCLPRSFVQS